MSKKKIVILGAGYAGILAAQTLEKKLDFDNAEVTLINKNDYHYLKTELHQPAAGTFPIEKTRVFIDEILDANKTQFIQDEIIQIKADEQIVELKNSEIEYDYLIVSLGSEAETFNIPGLKENAFGKWTLNGIQKLHDHIEEKVKGYVQTQNPADLTFVVGGAGFTGIEFVSELVDALPNLCKQYGVDPSLVKIVNAEASPSILAGFDPKLIEYAQKYLEDKGVAFHIGVPIKECKEGSVILADDTTIQTGTVVWAAGVRGNCVIEKSGIENVRGRVQVDGKLHAPGYENIFVVGDCAVVINKEQNRPYPPTAQIAMQMGECIGKNIASIINGKGELVEFTPDIKGTVASLGRKNAVGVAFGHKLNGKPAVIMKKVIDLRYLYIIGGVKMALKKGRF